MPSRVAAAVVSVTPSAGLDGSAAFWCGGAMPVQAIPGRIASSEIGRGDSDGWGADAGRPHSRGLRPTWSASITASPICRQMAVLMGPS